VTISSQSVSTFTTTRNEDVEACKHNAILKIAADRMLEPCNRALANSATVLHNRIATHYHRGLISQHLDNFSSARYDFKKALELDAKFGEANLALASLSYVEDNFDDTLSYVVLAMHQTIQHPAYAHYLKGMVYTQRFAFQDARSEFKTALKFRPLWRNVKRQLAYIDRNWPQ